jgi:probable rRNA maturation factor
VRAVRATLRIAGAPGGHVALALVSPGEIRRLNREHRGLDAATDVLSFPVDGVGPTPGQRELGDVVISADEADDVVEAVVHGVLHLLGYDHEADAGEMLALQARIIAELR